MPITWTTRFTRDIIINIKDLHKIQRAAVAAIRYTLTVNDNKLGLIGGCVTREVTVQVTVSLRAGRLKFLVFIVCQLVFI